MRGIILMHGQIKPLAVGQVLDVILASRTNCLFASLGLPGGSQIAESGVF